MAKTCTKCSKEITGAFLSAEGGHFCPGCFVCDKCGNPLTGPYAKTAEGRVCGECKTKTICAKCGKEIIGASLAFGDKKFHPECFTCKGCDKALDKVFVVNDDLFCEVCAKKAQQAAAQKAAESAEAIFAPTQETGPVCAGCGKEITGERVKADQGKFYHPECFVCSKCKAPITSNFHRDDGGNLVCGKCNKPAPAGGGGGGSVPSKPKQDKPPCTGCGQPIVGDILVGHMDDKFCEKCFVCAECNCKLEEFAIDPNRQYKYQKARYLCKPCAAKVHPPEAAAEDPCPTVTKSGYDPGSYGVFEKRASNAGPMKCIICKGEDVKEGEGCMLADGRVIHWKCFKCVKCGHAGQPKDMKLFRSKVDKVIAGTYVCDDCSHAESKVNAAAPPTFKRLSVAAFCVTQGPYFGQGRSASGSDVKFMIRLEKGGKCKIEQASAGEADPALAWTDEGTYAENKDESGKICESITFTGSLSIKTDEGWKERSMEFRVEKGESHNCLVCEGIKCSLLIGTPESELKLKMRPQQASRKNEAVVAADPLYADTSTTYSLEQVQKDWKSLDLDPSKREMYLSDADFQTHFKVDKAAFASQPKWKRDNKKKDLKLF